ncbi:MAG TPA: hypothetical protein P5180_12360 [Bacteroidales bacterium]|nr:hypothetical protein [Bacteroidales bacterium]
MKSTEKKKFVMLIIVLVSAGTISLYAQQNQGLPRLKTVTVYEEKFDKLLSHKYKESETTYDERGNILEDIQYKEGKVDKHFRFQYDDNNNKIKETELDASGQIIEYSEYRFENNLRVEKWIYDPRGRLKTHKEYVYTIYPE